MPRKNSSTSTTKTQPAAGAATPAAAAASPAPSAASLAETIPGLPFCRVGANRGNLRIVMVTEGLLSAGGLFQVVPIFGPTQPVPEEQWQMTAPKSGRDSHDMLTTPKHLDGDGINFQINVCGHSPQFPNGAVEVAVEQEGVPCPINPPMRFELTNVAMCQSPEDKIMPTKLTGGFAITFA